MLCRGWLGCEVTLLPSLKIGNYHPAPKFWRLSTGTWVPVPVPKLKNHNPRANSAQSIVEYRYPPAHSDTQAKRDMWYRYSQLSTGTQGLRKIPTVFLNRSSLSVTKLTRYGTQPRVPVCNVPKLHNQAGASSFYAVSSLFDSKAPAAIRNILNSSVNTNGTRPRRFPRTTLSCGVGALYKVPELYTSAYNPIKLEQIPGTGPRSSRPVI